MRATLTMRGTNGNGSVFFNVLSRRCGFPAPCIGASDDGRSAEVTLPEGGAGRSASA
jgi:hypothetical protein